MLAISYEKFLNQEELEEQSLRAELDLLRSFRNEMADVVSSDQLFYVKNPAARRKLEKQLDAQGPCGKKPTNLTLALRR